MKLKTFYKLLFLLFIIMTEFCEWGIHMDYSLLASDNNIKSIPSTIYDETDLDNIVNSNMSLRDLNNAYPVEHIKEENGVSRVVFIGNDHIAVLVYDNLGNKLLGKKYEIRLHKSDFIKLSKGMPIEKVMDIDPHGEYLFFETGRNDIPKQSTHFTKDGYIIIIEYDNMFRIKKIFNMKL